MQHSADFTSFLAYQADIARAERAIEIRRSIAERRERDAQPTTESSVNSRRHARRTPRLATR